MEIWEVPRLMYRELDKPEEGVHKPAGERWMKSRKVTKLPQEDLNEFSKPRICNQSEKHWRFWVMSCAAWRTVKPVMPPAPGRHAKAVLPFWASRQLHHGQQTRKIETCKKTPACLLCSKLSSIVERKDMRVRAKIFGGAGGARDLLGPSTKG